MYSYKAEYEDTMNRQELAKPSAKLQPRDPASPRHRDWKRSIGRAVRAAAKRRRKGGILSIRDLAQKGPFSAQAIRQFMDRGELLFVAVGQNRLVFEAEYERFLRSKSPWPWAIPKK
jgi:hypothetical protein